ncbi:putative integral membrane zinc-ribbon metal-binding protein [Rhizoctonia solani]|uniref:Endoplasmic reticulum junction formation protein lunapark n=1 Tax=Rhizoctonia solani TaxID=456999 RepID=A0A8H7M5L9_9AGAM|nr:putative integral membrane zinc-ribbon metal-binding protein [Rhizoctonia solani]
MGIWGIYLAAGSLLYFPPSRATKHLGTGESQSRLTKNSIERIYQVRRLVQSWYKRQEALEEAELKKLRAEQKKKVEEVKAKYNFDKIRALIETQAESPRREDPNSNLRQRAITMNPTAPRMPARQINQRVQPPLDTRSPHMLQVPGAAPPRPMLPPQRGWLDKVADKVLGEDESPVGIAQSRYALICERCFSHNGLVKESEWETTHKEIRNSYLPPLSDSYFPRSPILFTPTTDVASRASHSPLSPIPGSSEPPSQDHPSQDQPNPEEMDVDTSSS